MNRPLKLSLAVALALASSNAFALGLGVIEVRSKMNEPLVAEIPVTVSDPEEAEGLKVKLAGLDDLKRVGIDSSGLSVPLEFTLSKDANGRPVILVTSIDPVREPIMSFLLEANWPKGKMLREYSVLLDPPVAPAIVGSRAVAEPIVETAPPPAEQLEMEPAAPVEPVAEAEPPSEPLEPALEPSEPAPAPVEPEPAPEPVPQAEPEPQAAVPEPEPEPAPVLPAPEPQPEPERTPGEYGPVASGETLWEIANNTRPTRDISVNQMMVAILRANPDGFFQDNVNALKRGAILRIPARDEVESLSALQATAEISAQHQAWSDRSTALVADSGTTDSSFAPTPTAPTPVESRLELVPPKAGTGSTASGDQPGVAEGTDTSGAVRADLSRTREQLASREQEAGELRTRVQELEKIKTDSDKLITFKDSEIAELQRRIAAADAEVARLKAEQETADAAAADAAAAAEAAAATAAATPAPTPEVDAPAVEPAPEVAPTEPPAESTPPVDTAVTEPEATPTEDLAATEPVAEEPVPLESTPEETPPVDTSAEAQPTEDGAEVTPLAEAAPADLEPASDAASKPWYANPFVLGGAALVALLALVGLFMRSRRAPAEDNGSRPSVADSFGSGVFSGQAVAAASADADEEHELLERLAADPTDTDAHLDLLRLYYARGDADKFEAAAGALYAQIPSADAPAWQRATEMGRSLCPGNPLFESAAPTSSGTAAEEFDFAHIEPPATPRAKFDTPTTPPSPPSPSSAESFDFNLIDSTAPASRTPAFDTRIDKPDLSTQQMSAIDPRLEPVSLDTDQSVAAQDSFAGDDAVGTKLDLARAYLDMGDPDGARSMLQEVVAEGTDSQRAEAKRLLSDIG